MTAAAAASPIGRAPERLSDVEAKLPALNGTDQRVLREIYAKQIGGAPAWLSDLVEVPALAGLSRDDVGDSIEVLQEQGFDDAEPLLGKRLFAESLSSPSIPIASVAVIAFFAVQISVHPRAIAPFVILGVRVGALPVAFRIPPESG